MTFLTGVHKLKPKKYEFCFENVFRAAKTFKVFQELEKLKRGRNIPFVGALIDMENKFLKQTTTKKKKSLSPWSLSLNWSHNSDGWIWG